MRELSLYILDIATNSLKAKATRINIELIENDIELLLKIKDNGIGMSKELQKQVTDPFVTTRTSRGVGLGLPFLKLIAEQTGGYITINSRTKEESSDGSQGTEVVAAFNKRSMDYIPLGDIGSTMVALIQGSPETDFVYDHKVGETNIEIDTMSLLAVLKDREMLREYEVLEWIKNRLAMQYKSIGYINC